MKNSLVELVISGNDIRRMDNKKRVSAIPVDRPMAYLHPKEAIWVSPKGFKNVAPADANAFCRNFLSLYEYISSIIGNVGSSSFEQFAKCEIKVHAVQYYKIVENEDEKILSNPSSESN